MGEPFKLEFYLNLIKKRLLFLSIVGTFAQLQYVKQGLMVAVVERLFFDSSRLEL